MKLMIKNLLKSLLRNLLKILWILPVKKNQVFFISFMGSTIGCSPYSICKELQNRNKNLKIIWCCNKPELYGRVKENNVSFVKFNSLAYLIALLTSKILINNASFPTWVPFRMKKQVIINTWHGGGAYKKVAASEVNSKAMYKRVLQSAKDTTWFISSCKIFTDVMIPSTLVEEKKFLNIGMPRNDIFFNNVKSEKAKKKVLEYYSIGKDYFVILYAPTYRGASFATVEYDSHIDLTKIREAIKHRFNKDAYIIFRGHYFGDSSDISNFDLNASDYPDMQELLCASDMLITDYSSSMWDFSFTKKPCLLFTPDINKYKSERGFYTEPEEWGFPFALNNDELISNIENFNVEKYESDMEKTHQYFGSYEKGTATISACNLILKELQIEN